MDSNELLKEFELDLKQVRYSPCTIKQYIWNVEQMLAYMEKSEGITRIDQIDRKVLRHWNANAAERWQPATHRQAVAAVKAFFKFLASEGIIQQNPAADFKLPPVPDRKQRTLTAEELKILLDAAMTMESPKRERERALICLLADSGLRVSEACRLKIDDLSLKHHLLLVISKGDKEEPGTFGKMTADYLQVWLEARQQWLKAKKRSDPGTVFIALGGLKPGNSLTPDGLRRVFKNLGAEAALRGVSPHAFRRAFATLLHENGAPSRVAQLAGRWSNLKMVESYTRALEETEKLPGLFGPYSPIDRLLEKGKDEGVPEKKD